MSTCSKGNEYDGRLALRISSIAVITIASFLGAWLPVFIGRCKRVKVPEWVICAIKYIGSGVVVGTAFIHLVAPAHEALSNPCLTGVITEYPWVEGICLMAIFALLFVELMVMRYGQFGNEHGAPHTHAHQAETVQTTLASKQRRDSCQDLELGPVHSCREVQRNHEPHVNTRPGSYAAQLTGVFILEFGVIFHSIFVGLTLALAGKEFTTLYVVLTFHQMFEGFALGSRLASIEWPESKRWTPHVLAGFYSISTPIAIGIGLGVRSTYNAGNPASLITNGVFDSISAGILIYTGLVELIAHDFIFNTHMQQEQVWKTVFAFGALMCGAGLMAMLGKWA